MIRFKEFLQEAKENIKKISAAMKAVEKKFLPVVVGPISGNKHGFTGFTVKFVDEAAAKKEGSNVSKFCTELGFKTTPSPTKTQSSIITSEGKIESTTWTLVCFNKVTEEKMQESTTNECSVKTSINALQESGYIVAKKHNGFYNGKQITLMQKGKNFMLVNETAEYLSCSATDRLDTSWSIKPKTNALPGNTLEEKSMHDERMQKIFAKLYSLSGEEFKKEFKKLSSKDQKRVKHDMDLEHEKEMCKNEF